MTGPDDPAAGAAAEIAAAFAAGRPPDFAGLTRSAAARALRTLVAGGAFGAAAHGAAHVPWRHHIFSNLRFLLDTLPPEDPALPFRDDLSAEAQFARREGAETLIVVFSDVSGGAGAPLTIVHRWLAPLGASMLYLRDPRLLFFLGGVPALAEDRAATIAAIRAIASDWGCRRIACYSSSGGGFAALHYGLDLGARTIVALSAMTDLSPAFNEHLAPHFAAAARNKAALTAGLSLPAAWRMAADPPRALLVYGEDNWDDRIHATNMKGLTNVTLQPVARHRLHGLFAKLVRQGRIEATLRRLVED